MKAYFPDGTQIFDRASAIEVLEPGRPESIFYNRAEIVDVASTVASDGEVSLDHQVKDVIIIGEVRRFKSFNPYSSLIYVSRDIRHGASSIYSGEFVLVMVL